jgi:hypothetical protein
MMRAIPVILLVLFSVDAMAWEFQSPHGKTSYNFSGFIQPLYNLHTLENRLDVEAEAGLNHEEWSARLTPWFWTRVLDYKEGTHRYTRPYFEIKEGWIEKISESVDFRLGNQIFAWGAADQINPTDVWNPRDYYDPFQSYKLPVFSFRAKIHPPSAESLNIEFIATPFFKESQLPVVFPNDSGFIQPLALDSSRWILPIPTLVTAGSITAPLYFETVGPTYPATWQAGTRVQVNRVGNWDFSFSVYNGVEDMPRFAMSRRGSASTPSLPVTITFRPVFNRRWMFGLDGAGSVSPWDTDFGVRFEAAFFLRDNSRAYEAGPQYQADLLRDNYIHAVVGIDHTLKRKILGIVFYANLQFVFYERIGDLESRPGEFIIDGLPTMLSWDRNIVLYLEGRVGDRFKFIAQTVGSFFNLDGMFSPGLKYQFTDNLNAGLGADFFFGKPGGFFSQMRDNSRVNLSMSYSF